MLKGRHGSRIDVEIRVKFDQGDSEAPRFQNRGERGGGDSLAQGRHYTAGDEDKFGHVRLRTLEFGKLEKEIIGVCYIALFAYVERMCRFYLGGDGWI